MEYLAVLLKRSVADHRTDGELLRAFRADGNESAFAELLRRHGPLVWSVCRRGLGDRTDAEDAFQATFLVLVRRADQLAGSPAVGSWLFKVAKWTIGNIQRKNARHLKRFSPLPDSVPDPRNESEPVVDLETILRVLPRRGRDAILMCCLEGLSHHEAALRLGCAEGTVSSLISRGLARLRERFAGREPAAIAALAGLAVPAEVANAALRSASALRLASLRMAASPSVAALTHGVLRMFWIKKATAVGLAGVALVAVGIGLGMTVQHEPRAAANETIGGRIPEAAPVPGTVEPGSIHVTNADGSRALFNDIAQCGVGYPPGGATAPWVGYPDRDGRVSLAKLPAGTHWLLAAGSSEQRTPFKVKVPADPPLLERRLRDSRGTTRDLDIRSSFEDGETIVIDIRNTAKVALKVSEEEVNLVTWIGRESVRVLSPGWQTGKFASITIEAGQSGSLKLNWRDWVRKGLWSSRQHETMAEPAWTDAEPGKAWVRVAVGNNSTLPVSVPAPALLAEADDPLSRKVSLAAKAMPLKDALAALARAAKLELSLDAAALKEVGLDVERPVTVTFQDETLDSALGRLLRWSDHGGAFREVRGGKLIITTIQARQASVMERLPEWLKTHYTRGLLATLDDDHNVVSISTGDVLGDELLGRIKTLPKLRELNIGPTKRLTAGGLKHLAELTSLQKLSVYDLSEDGKGLGDVVLQHIAGLKSLRELSLGMCGTTDAGIKRLEALPHLTHLTLSTEGLLTDAALAAIGTLKRLRLLDLSSYVATEKYGRMRFSEDGIRRLAGLKELEELHLGGHAVPAEAIAFPRLNSLSLGDDVDDDCAARIATLRELKTLNLVYTKISDDGLKAIAGLPALRRLNLDSHFVTDAGIAHLKKLEALEHVSLRTSKITDESLRHLAEIRGLTRLDLNGSGEPGAMPGKRFTIAGVQRLKALPRLRTLELSNLESAGRYAGLGELKQLRELTLMMTDIREDEVESLEESLPDATIRHVTGGGGRSRPRKAK